MKDKPFTKIKLSDGAVCEIVDPKAKHFFAAVEKAKGITSLLSKYFIIEIVKINGNKISNEYFDEMPMADVSHIIECMNVLWDTELISKLYKKP